MAPVEPKPAAVCVILNERGEVLLGRRSLELRFMPGRHVFPGGRIDENESDDHVLDYASHAEAIAVKAAAREAFEESGLLLAEGELPEAEVRRQARLGLLANDLTFNDILAEFGLVVRATDFERAGHWVTPEVSPIRFDTQYWLHRFHGGQTEELIEGELTALEWMLPADARRRWHLGEIDLPTAVSYTLQHLAALEYPRYLEVLGRPNDRRRGVVPTRVEMHRGIHYIPLATRTIPPATHTNCIVVGEHDILVIDPGSDLDEELTHLKSQLDHMLELGGRIHACILTHSHIDHTAGVDFVQQTYGVPLWAHAETARQIDHKVDRHIEDEEVIVSPGDPEWRLRALHTPGHDPGHLAFFEESTRTLLAGDMIANPGTIVVSEAYGGNMDQFLASLERLMELDAQLIIPSHGHPEEDPRAVLRKHRDHRLWRENKIKEAYEAGATTIEELLKTAYDDAPEAALQLAEHALKAHLTRLGIEAV